jgi:hypothetical protein
VAPGSYIHKCIHLYILIHILKYLPDAIFCAQSLSKVLPIAKLIVAAIVALTNTVKKPGKMPKKSLNTIN